MTNVWTNSTGTRQPHGTGSRLIMSRPAKRFLLLLCAIAAFVAGCTDPGWQELTIPEGGFRVLMQGAPRVETNSMETPVGKITGHLYSVEATDAAFGVGYSDFPAEIVRATTPRQLFTVVREGWVKRIQGTLQGDGTDIKLESKYPGMEIIAWGKLDGRDAYLRGRFYLVGDRLYQLIVFGTKSAMPVSDINHFLGSFKLTPRHETSTVTVDKKR